MNLQLSPTSLPELEQIVTTLFAESKCACHVINPHKTRILLWKETKAKDGVIYHLRIGIQKFISQEQTDRNGEIYWRMYSAEVNKELGGIKEGTKVSDFKKSQESFQNSLSAEQNNQTPTEHEQNSEKEIPTQSVEGLEESEQVKKFRAKYGRPNQSQN